MIQNKMFDLVREDVKEVADVEKWYLKQRINPDDPDSSKISQIQVSTSTKILGEFQLAHISLVIVQEHIFGQPPKHVRFALMPEGIIGDALIRGKKSGNLLLLVGELGTEEGRLFQPPMAKGVDLAVLDWIESLSKTTYW